MNALKTKQMTVDGIETNREIIEELKYLATREIIEELKYWRQGRL